MCDALSIAWHGQPKKTSLFFGHITSCLHSPYLIAWAVIVYFSHRVHSKTVGVIVHRWTDKKCLLMYENLKGKESVTKGESGDELEQMAKIALRYGMMWAKCVCHSGGIKGKMVFMVYVVRMLHIEQANDIYKP